MSARITGLKVANFRSIRGTLDINLDAPVVLVHGSNGSGKTSLLSAIEMGLTGGVASLRRFDAEYEDHLIHSGKTEALVAVRCRRDGMSDLDAELRIRDGTVIGDALLTDEMGRFFTERCFLAQATLGRLLEIYETSDARDEDTPLTRFVKDLLGLDQLDDLLDGLFHLRDVRRLRTSLPLYADVEAEAKRLGRQLKVAAEEAQNANRIQMATQELLMERLKPLGIDALPNMDQLIEALADRSDELEAVRLSKLRREVTAALSLWMETSAAFNTEGFEAAEALLQQALEAFDAWESTHGERVLVTLSRAASLIQGLPSAERAGFSIACDAASTGIKEELDRCQARRSEDDDYRQRLQRAREDAAKFVARILRLDARLETLSEDNGAIARALSEIAPFVKDEICPVCHRDYSEHRDVPLYAHLTTHIASLSRAASELQEVTSERQAELRALNKVQASIRDLESRLLSEEARADLLRRVATLAETSESLKAIADLAAVGSARRAAVEQASDRLSRMRREEKTLTGLRESIADFPTQLGIEGPQESESIERTLTRCADYIAERQAEIDRLRGVRMSALETARQFGAQSKYLHDQRERVDEIQSVKVRVDEALERAEKTRTEGKRLATFAEQARTGVVRQVFNDRLNEIWRDLFIRLAPDEKFIPAFALPANERGPVEAKLETRFRDGGLSGNPRSILSAGNLNTAALTLFLSLHLSVDPVLPWLVIDDPVQSMDEIHKAQFAALLRTLSRQGGRQVIIAVHEKPLFDYLALELSPASERDRLITIELSRAADADTQQQPTIKTWDPDLVYSVSVAS